MLIGIGRRPVILLVDDDAGDQELTRRALAEDECVVDLRVVSNGAEAMDYLLRSGRFSGPDAAPTPDIVLLDLNMPKVDGREVLRRVRSEPALAHLVVVVLTTSGEPRDVHDAYALQCNSFITKPVSMDRFNRTIREVRNYWFGIATLPRSDRTAPAAGAVNRS